MPRVARRRADLEAVGRLEARVGKALGELVVELRELEAHRISLREDGRNDAGIAGQIVHDLDQINRKAFGRERCIESSRPERS